MVRLGAAARRSFSLVVTVLSSQPLAVKRLIGKRVVIRANYGLGSTKKLDGLIAVVVREHPLALNWVKIELEPNTVTPFIEWSIHTDVLHELPIITAN